jgi:hypothetical protein
LKNPLKKASTEAAQRAQAQYRWCEKEERYTALAVCKSRETGEKQCRACLFLWRQLPLPFPEPKSRKNPAGKDHA